MADLIVEKTNHLGILKLNRPDRMNAISVEMLNDLGEALKDFDSDPKVRAIILTGEGRGFCSGLDLKDTAAGRGIGAGLAAPGASHVSTRELPTVTLHRIDLPVICAINGAAAGYGFDLALGCDLRLISDRAKLVPAFAKRGIVPESGGTWYLPRLVGWAKACEIGFIADDIGPARAVELGLANKVVAHEELMEEATRWASKIAANAPLAIRAMKRLFRHGLSEDFESHTHHVLMQLLVLFRSGDFKEGLEAFMAQARSEFQRAVTGRSAARFSETGTGFADAKLSEILPAARVARFVRMTERFGQIRSAVVIGDRIRLVVAAGAGLHERDRDAVERVDDARDLAALNRQLGLGRLQAVLARDRDRSRDVGAHQREAPASGTSARRRPYDFQHGLLEFEECLPRTVADFTDSLARDADRLVGGDRVFEHGSHHDDVFEIVDSVGVRPAQPRERLAARLDVEGNRSGGGHDARQSGGKHLGFGDGLRQSRNCNRFYGLAGTRLGLVRDQHTLDAPDPSDDAAAIVSAGRLAQMFGQR